MTHTAHQQHTSAEVNKLRPQDRPVHGWYRFVLSFPPHLVRHYLHRLGVGTGQQVLDPFCGTGTVVVECKKLGIPSIGVEANPMAHFAGQVKVDWSLDPDALRDHAEAVARTARDLLSVTGVHDQPCLQAALPHGAALRDLLPDARALLLSESISPLPLHKVLVLRDCIGPGDASPFSGHERLALARAAVQHASNLHFGPEVGIGPAKRDAAVIAPWLDTVCGMAADLRAVSAARRTPAQMLHADARRLSDVLGPRSIDAVITSPPYPNEKDYTRATRLESVLLGFISTREELRALKRGLVRSNTRGVYRQDDDDRWVAGHPEIQRIAGAIEARRVELGKTSGFERQYARVTRLYFGGMARHLADLRPVLKPGARLAYVVGDQASFLRVMIRTGELLAEIACSLGYQREGIDLFRTRLATATREQLREEVVLLRWPGT